MLSLSLSLLYAMAIHLVFIEWLNGLMEWHHTKNDWRTNDLRTLMVLSLPAIAIYIRCAQLKSTE